MQALSEELLLKRRRFIGWLNAGLYGFSGAVLIAVAATLHDVDVGVVAVAGLYCIAHVVGGVGCALGKRWGTLVLWPLCIVDLVVFPLGTIMGGYSLYILAETRDSMGISGKTLGIAAVVPVLLLAGAVVERFASHPSAPAADAFLAAIAAQGGSREFDQWVHSLPQDSTRIAIATARLEAQGLLHLDTATQLVRVHLVEDGLLRLSIHDCASLGRGTASWEQQRAFTTGFDSSGLAAWMEIRARAILATLRDSTTPPAASEREINDYALSLYRSLSPTDQRRYQTLASSVASASDSDVCWFTRLYNGRALQPNPSRARWVRVILSQAVAGDH